MGSKEEIYPTLSKKKIATTSKRFVAAAVGRYDYGNVNARVIMIFGGCRIGFSHTYACM